MRFLTRLWRSALTKTLSLPLGERVKAGRRQLEREHVKAVCPEFRQRKHIKNKGDGLVGLLRKTDRLGARLDTVKE